MREYGTRIISSSTPSEKAHALGSGKRLQHTVHRYCCRTRSLIGDLSQAIQAHIKMNPGTTTPAQTADHNLTRRPRGESKHHVHRPQLALQIAELAFAVRSMLSRRPAAQMALPATMLLMVAAACLPAAFAQSRPKVVVRMYAWWTCSMLYMLHVSRWLHVRQSCWLHTARCVADGACHTSIASDSSVLCMPALPCKIWHRHSCAGLCMLTQ